MGSEAVELLADNSLQWAQCSQVISLALDLEAQLGHHRWDLVIKASQWEECSEAKETNW